MSGFRVRLVAPAVVLLAALAFVIFYLQDRAASRKSSEGDDEGRSRGGSCLVTTAPLVRGILQQSVPAYGHVVPGPSGSISVAVSYDCRVQSIRVRPGQPVRKGEILCTLEESAEGRLALEQARIAEAAAEKSREQTQRLHDLKLAGNQDLTHADETYRSAHAELASLEARRAAVAHGVAAPADGVVARVDAQAGALVAAGTTLVELSGAADREIVLGVEPSIGERLSPGDTLRVHDLSAKPGEALAARIRAVSPAVDPASRLLNVYAELPPGAPWLLDQFVAADVVASSGEGLLVPASAVLSQDGGEILFTVANGRAHRHRVTVLRRTEEKVQLAPDSLQAGEAAVVSGNYELADGDSVRVEAAR